MSDVPARKGNGSDNNRDDDWGVDRSQQAYPSRFDEDSMSGGVLLYNLDCGTLEPPSPQPPSPERQGSGRDDVGAERGQQCTGISRRKKRREKRTMTSLYVRYCLACLFLFHALPIGKVIVGIGGLAGGRKPMTQGRCVPFTFNTSSPQLNTDPELVNPLAHYRI